MICNDVALLIRCRFRVISIRKLQGGHVKNTEPSRELISRVEWRDVDAELAVVWEFDHSILRRVDPADDEHLPVAYDLTRVPVAGLFGRIANFEPLECWKTQDEHLIKRNSGIA